MWFKKKKKVEDIFTYKLIAEKETGWWDTSSPVSIVLGLEFKNSYRNISRFERIYMSADDLGEGGKYEFLATGTKEEKEEKFIKVRIMEYLEKTRIAKKEKKEIRVLMDKIEMTGSLKIEEGEYNNETN